MAACPAVSSSGCVSRAIAVQPDVLLMDEPCSALDIDLDAGHRGSDRGTQQDFTIVIVTHNMQQAARVSDQTAFFNLGRRVSPAS